MERKDTTLFGRLGNKKTDIKFFSHLLPLDIKNVVEPFGGSFAVIKIVYGDDKYQKYVNDNDPYLVAIYKNPQKYSDLSIKINKIAGENKNEKGNVIFLKFMEALEKDDTIEKDIFTDYWKKEKIVRGNIVKSIKNPSHKNQIEMMKKIIFTSVDYMETLDKHYMNKDTFIFLDPPYLFSDNNNYSSQSKKDGDMDTTDMIINILDVLQNPLTKAKIMLIINDLKILRHLYKDFIKGDYDRVYQIGKRKEKHLIITNYD